MRALLAGTEYEHRTVVIDSVESTNDELRRLAESGAPALTAVIANHQISGRGRQSRTWHSPAGLGLYVSMLFRPSRPAAETMRWTLAAGMAAALACREVSGAEVVIEWPNDLVFEGRKLAGTLAEARTTGSVASELVVGTGINVHQRENDFPEQIRPLATSLHIIAPSARLERELLAALYLRRLGALAERLEAGGWPAVRREWASMAPGAHGCRVRVVADAASEGSGFEGVTRGLDPTGGLVVERADGRRTVVRLSDSVRPLEG